MLSPEEVNRTLIKPDYGRIMLAPEEVMSRTMLSPEEVKKGTVLPPRKEEPLAGINDLGPSTEPTPDTSFGEAMTPVRRGLEKASGFLEKNLMAPIEAIESLITGVASFPVSRGAKLIALAKGKSEEEAEKIEQGVAEKMTFQPTTPMGQKIAGILGTVVSLPAEIGREVAKLPAESWGLEGFSKEAALTAGELAAYAKTGHLTKKGMSLLKREKATMLSPEDIKLPEKIEKPLLSPEDVRGAEKPTPTLAEVEKVQPAPSGEAKQPWMMTREEFRDAVRQQGEVVKYTDAWAIDDYNKEGTIDYAFPKKITTGSETYSLHIGGSKIRGKSMGSSNQLFINGPRGFFEKISIGNSEFGKKHTNQALRLIRKHQIQQALSEGKPVPPEVLKDYPDLAKELPTAGRETVKGAPQPGKTEATSRATFEEQYWPETEEAKLVMTDMVNDLRENAPRGVNEIEGEFVPYGSTYPQWFKDMQKNKYGKSKSKGVAAKEVDAVISNYLSGKELTDRQHGIFNDILISAKELSYDSHYQRAVQEIHKLEDAGGALSNAQERLRSEIAEEWGLSGEEAERALNELSDYFDSLAPEKPFTPIPQQKQAEVSIGQGGETSAPEMRAETALEIDEGLPEISKTAETKKSTLAIKTEASAIEKGMVENFGELPEYETMNMKEQAERALKIVDSDFQTAKNMALGRANLPEGLRDASIYQAVKQRALENGDVMTLKRLATESPVPQKLSAYGQAIKAADWGEEIDPVKAMYDISKEREKVAVKRGATKKAKQQVVDEIKKEIKRKAPTKETWVEFVESLRC